MTRKLVFPTPLHQQVAEAAYNFFQPQAAVDSVLVTNSIARGQGVPESDLDMNVLVREGTTDEEVRRLETLWQAEFARSRPIQEFLRTGIFAHLHLDVTRGDFTIPEPWDDGGGPDFFEVSLGNALAYAAPLHEAGAFYRKLQDQWLPYYDEGLRRERLAMARAAVLYDLEHVPFFVRRELPFQAFDRLYKAFQEFLQALFLSRKVYPLAYNKWIRMQVEDWLGLPDLYRELPEILSVADITGADLIQKARALRGLLEAWVGDPSRMGSE